jgi:23S rRNA (cytidine1920-2'-O)/16S rRNA (cytidine1409-2'-O)-methyltransferase
MTPKGTVVALVKPQFEAERSEVGEGGIVRDPGVHERVVTSIKAALPGLGFQFHGVVESPILGGDGNKEFLLVCSKQ